MNTVATSGPSADLTVTKFGPTALETGQTTMYMIIVQNDGPGSAENVTVTDDVPPGMTIVWVDQSQGVCSHTTTQVTCNLGTVPNGASEYVIIQVTAPASAGTITNTASVSSTTTDPTPSNDTDTVQTTVTSSSGTTADLSITKTASPNPVAQVGENVTYTVTVTNNGPGTATGAVMLDLLPQAVTFLSATPSQGSCQAPLVNGTLECDIGTLANGASMTVTVVVQTTMAGLIGNSASVFADQADPDFSNNVTGMVVTNVGDVSRLANISTRAYVSTGDNVMIGGFFVGGTLPKQFLIRARGPSLGGAPFNNEGVMANPTMQLYSGSTVIAQNNNWGAFDATCVSPCAAVVPVTSSSVPGYTPCDPNPGQSVAPPGCAQESALLVTLPPGGYTAIVSGVGGTSGVGLVEVFDLVTGTLPKLVNISTRALVLTGDSVMIGGFWIGGGTGSKTVLLRARGPSLGAPPFNNPGVLANPTFQLFSGATVIAQNNDWQSTDLLCASPATACGDATQITATGLDPCQPNPGQNGPPAGCDAESAILVTLPPGGYTAIVQGVGNTTGMGLVEIFEMSP